MKQDGRITSVPVTQAAHKSSKLAKLTPMYVRFTYKEKSIGSVKYTETHGRDKFKITCSHTEPNMSANTLSEQQ